MESANSVSQKKEINSIKGGLSFLLYQYGKDGPETLPLLRSEIFFSPRLFVRAVPIVSPLSHLPEPSKESGTHPTPSALITTISSTIIGHVCYFYVVFRKALSYCTELQQLITSCTKLNLPGIT